MKDLLLIGGGGHCRSCIDVIEAEDKYKIAGIVKKSESNLNQIFGYEVLGTDEDLPFLRKKYSFAIITVGQIKNYKLRINLFNKVQNLGFEMVSIISPRAYISKNTNIGSGTIIMHDALINSGAKIGNNCIINTKSLVEHDTTIENHCHISTSSVVNGGSIIGEGTFIGSNSTVREGISIGKNSIIGSGALIFSDIPEKTMIK